MTEGEHIQLENIADTEHEIFALLKQRYSPRTFKDENINDKHIQQLFEAARWSASSYNQQPWRFIYGVKGTDGYKNIFNCLSDFNKSWADNAPLLLFEFNYLLDKVHWFYKSKIILTLNLLLI